ncbi:hypothetical protein D3C71_1446580 [compost metagenome]
MTVQGLRLGAQVRQGRSEIIDRRFDIGGGIAGLLGGVVGRGRPGLCRRIHRAAEQQITAGRSRAVRLQLELAARGVGGHIDRSRGGVEQVDPVKLGARQRDVDFLGQGLKVGDQLLAVVAPVRRRRSIAGVVLNGDRQALQFVQGAGDGLAGRQGDIDDGLTALQRLLHRVLGAHFGALGRGDGEDGAIVLS